MKKLLNAYSLQSETEYYDMIIDSLINGQRKQAANQFSAMPRANRKNFIKYIFFSDEASLSRADKALFIDLW